MAVLILKSTNLKSEAVEQLSTHLGCLFVPVDVLLTSQVGERVLQLPGETPVFPLTIFQSQLQPTQVYTVLTNNLIYYITCFCQLNSSCRIHLNTFTLYKNNHLVM